MKILETALGSHLPFRNRVATSKQKSLRALTRATRPIKHASDDHATLEVEIYGGERLSDENFAPTMVVVGDRVASLHGICRGAGTGSAAVRRQNRPMGELHYQFDGRQLDCRHRLDHLRQSRDARHEGNSRRSAEPPGMAGRGSVQLPGKHHWLASGQANLLVSGDDFHFHSVGKLARPHSRELARLGGDTSPRRVSWSTSRCSAVRMPI